ncbi:MAG TPA: ATP synthase subunit C [Steroidobacteraceae bacterium]|nr:ATP synthase subunit C [Steroidobacteraceae bacterium]
MKVSRFFPLVAVVLAAGLAVGLTLIWLALPAHAAGPPGTPPDPAVLQWAFASAAAAAAIAAAAAAYAVAQVGAAAVGAVAEKPELFGRMLIFVGLAEGIAIYGLIVAVLIFNRVGV